MKSFSRPYQILSIEINKSATYFTRNKNELENIFFFKFDKKKIIYKKISTGYSKSIFCRFLDNSFFEIDKSGSGIIIRNEIGKKIKTYKFSKNKLKIESAVYNKLEKKLLLLDSKYNRIFKISFSFKKITLKNFKFKKNIIDLKDSCIEKFLEDKYLLSDYNSKIYIIDSNFKIIKKINAFNKSCKYKFRKIKSIKYCDGIIAVCDYLSHEIKFYDKNFKYLRFIGGKGTEKNKFDLPNHLDVNKNSFLVSDSNNDRIVKITKSFSISVIFKPIIKNHNLRRPIKVIEHNKYIFVLDRDNCRIIKYNQNLKFQKKIVIKKFYNSKPNSFVFIKFKKTFLLAVLYRFSNYTNKIIIYNLRGEFKSEIKVNLKDAQDLTSFGKNIIIADTNNRRLVFFNIETKKIKNVNLTLFTNNKRLLTKTVSCDQSGNIFTADFDKCIILKFNLKLKLIGNIKFNNIKDELKVIRSIYVYKNYLFITNRSKYPLLIYDLLKKKIIKRIGSYLLNGKKSLLSNPTSTCFYNHNVFIADKENDVVIKIKLQ
jgi:hypothetical protein